MRNYGQHSMAFGLPVGSVPVPKSGTAEFTQIQKTVSALGTTNLTVGEALAASRKPHELVFIEPQMMLN